MRPDDSFGTPGTRINLSSNQPTPVSVVRHASSGQSGSGGGHQYSMTIRPGERKTQRIELPGLTLELVVSLDA